eukprot:5323822-Amphidinium_carterae.1
MRQNCAIYQLPDDVPINQIRMLAGAAAKVVDDRKSKAYKKPRAARMIERSCTLQSIRPGTPLNLLLMLSWRTHPFLLTPRRHFTF